MRPLYFLLALSLLVPTGAAAPLAHCESAGETIACQGSEAPCDELILSPSPCVLVSLFGSFAIWVALDLLHEGGLAACAAPNDCSTSIAGAIVIASRANQDANDHWSVTLLP